MLKQQVHDWISYLNNGQQRLETRIAALENKLAKLENKQEKEIIIK
jgi:predicted ribosome quality control (RQC) complex YloA/Tae2 family protein